MTCRRGDLREEISRIRATLAAEYSVAHLARLYGCARTNMQRIIDGESYKDLPFPEA